MSVGAVLISDSLPPVYLPTFTGTNLYRLGARAHVYERHT